MSAIAYRDTALSVLFEALSRNVKDPVICNKTCIKDKVKQPLDGIAGRGPRNADRVPRHGGKRASQWGGWVSAAGVSVV